MHFAVRIAAQAQDDLERLYEFLCGVDAALALRAIDQIEKSLRVLEHSPFICRRALAHPSTAQQSRLRELVIPFGAAGYVALFDIEDEHTVTVLAFRHQREDDFTL